MMKIRTMRVLVAVLLVGVGIAGCNSKGSKADVDGDSKTDKTFDVSKADVDGDSKTFDVSDGTMTYGNHTYTMEGNIADEYREGATGKVTFTNIPSGFMEFKAVYEEFLGKTPYGTAAMLPMAFEIWARDNSTGERCLELLCYDICMKEILRELPRHIKNSKHSPSDDPYVQRCMTAATLAGATKENGYNPQEPYTLTMAIGLPNTWKQESEVLQGYRYTLDIIAGGNAWNNPKRSVTVQRGWKDELYKANTCGSLYINIYAPREEWKGLK